MRKIVISLLAVNLVLAGYLMVVLVRKGARPKQPVIAMPVDEFPGPTDFAANRRPKTTRAHQPRTDKFSWTALASSDLRRYASNLREVGCPEETIREIMLAEVNRVFGAQERALKVRPDDVAPWEMAALYDRRNGETKLRQLLEEKRNLLKELTGVDIGIDMPSRLAGRDIGKFEGAFAAVPEDKRDRVRAIQENYWAQSDDIKQRTMGYLEPEDREEFTRIKAERRDALATVLTPRELQDYELKSSDTASALRSRFEGFEVTDEEFRKVFEFMQPLDDQYSLGRRNPDPVNPEFTAARSQAEKDVISQIHSVLGDERYAEYQRSRDPAYRTISKVGAEAGAPKESVVQAYQAQQQLQQDAKRILQDASLTQEQRVQSLQAMQTQAQQTMQQLFGEKGAQLVQRLPEFRKAERSAALIQRIPVLPTQEAGTFPARQP